MLNSPVLPERFWSKIEVTLGPLDTPCWIWTGCQVGKYAKEGRGYGGFGVGGKTQSAHLVAYENLIGPRPVGLVADHLCDTPPCCNPHHLEFKPNRDNVIRGVGPSAVNARKTHCDHGHEFTAWNTLKRADGNRRCRQCHYDDVNERKRRRRREAKEAAV